MVCIYLTFRTIPSLFILASSCYQVFLDSSILSFTLYMHSSLWIYFERNIFSFNSNSHFWFFKLIFIFLFHNTELNAIHHRWYSHCFIKFNVLSLLILFFNHINIVPYPNIARDPDVKPAPYTPAVCPWLDLSPSSSILQQPHLPPYLHPVWLVLCGENKTVCIG